MMMNPQSNTQSSEFTNKNGVNFHQWKNSVNSLYQTFFQQDSANLTDLHYFDMFIENVDENMVVQCMRRYLNNYS